MDSAGTGRAHGPRRCRPATREASCLQLLALLGCVILFTRLAHHSFHHRLLVLHRGRGLSGLAQHRLQQRLLVLLLRALQQGVFQQLLLDVRGLGLPLCGVDQVPVRFLWQPAAPTRVGAISTDEPKRAPDRYPSERTRARARARGLFVAALASS